MNATGTLRGLRVLIAEDNRLIGELLREMLEGLGCVVIGPVPDLAELMAVIEAERLDAALLDVRLADTNVFPAAIELASRGIPFVLTSGGGVGLPAVLARAPHLTKPFDAQRLEKVMEAAFLPRVGAGC
jgi:DNA-binding NtrC family response regulator